MEVKKTISEKVELAYEVTDAPYIYMDVLLFAPEDFGKLDVDKLISEKYSVWRAYVDNPPVEDKVKKLASLIQQKVSIEKEIAVLSKDASILKPV